MMIEIASNPTVYWHVQKAAETSHPKEVFTVTDRLGSWLMERQAEFSRFQSVAQIITAGGKPAGFLDAEMTVITSEMAADEAAERLMSVWDFGDVESLITALWRRFFVLTGQECGHDMPAVRAVTADAVYCTTCGQVVSAR